MKNDAAMTLETAHTMARARWGRDAFASELDGVYRVGVQIGKKRVTMGEGRTFAEAVKDAGLPRVRRTTYGPNGNRVVVFDSARTGGRSR
jgi:hypothetical protein